MSTVSKIITLLIFGAMFVLVITHPAGFASDALAVGNVGTGVLSIESGAGSTGGVHGYASNGAFSTAS
jgi:hypothetical protein